MNPHSPIHSSTIEYNSSTILANLRFTVHSRCRCWCLRPLMFITFVRMSALVLRQCALLYGILCEPLSRYILGCACVSSTSVRYFFMHRIASRWCLFRMNHTQTHNHTVNSLISSRFFVHALSPQCSLFIIIPNTHRYLNDVCASVCTFIILSATILPLVCLLIYVHEHIFFVGLRFGVYCRCYNVPKNSVAHTLIC